jgi:hypothetical protein
MLDNLAPYGHAIALVAGILVAFGVWLGTRHSDNQLRERDAQLLERADENARLQGELRAASEETMRQVTGRGGYAFIVPNYARIDPALAARDGIVVPDVIPVWFGVLNNSPYPVIGVHVHIMQRVPVGEGFEGSDGRSIFDGRIGDVFPSTGQVQVGAIAELRKDRDNRFDILLRARAANFTQRLVITWVGDHWEQDYELKQTPDADRGNAEIVFRTIRSDFPYKSQGNASLPE